MPIIKDPKMNPSKEADFGVLFNDDPSNEGYFLYYKGDLVESNPKRYFTAGTVVDISAGPSVLTRHKFKYDTGFFKTNIYEWVEISGSPNSGTGSVVQAINSTIAGQDLDFPNVKEYLSHYTDNSPSPKIE